MGIFEKLFGGLGKTREKIALEELFQGYAPDSEDFYDELEEMLDKRDFFRCSKSVIINISKIEKLKPEITRNILATLSNGEVIVVSRRYATELKKLIGIS